MNELQLAPGRLDIGGQPSVVLCSSVFPFRIPSELWQHRLELVRRSGYRMIDLYVHWGFHEEVEGKIDLVSQERDLARFLDLAHQQGLLVMARPGPYICSETDGGGLPWWLHGAGPGAPGTVRSMDPVYLEAVGRWFDAVMPVLAAAQTTRGGPVALVQIENELDFFDCEDPAAYMEQLAQRTRSHGIDVPIIACAGQGELSGATGDAAGVVPTVNLYPPDSSTTFDEETRYYFEELESRGLPLMVTETNRLHRTLRREILAGSRLVAPYLQTSGFNHLVLPSAGNWGDPGNLMTHDYDFGGYISADGQRRPEYDEAIRLSRTLDAWGPRLATARPVPLSDIDVRGIDAGGALALDGGGHIVGPAEVHGRDATVTLPPADPGDALEATVPAGTCPFWALAVPLAPWGVEGTLEVATAELVAVEHPAGADDAVGTLHLVFEGPATSRVRVRSPEGVLEQDGHGEAARGDVRIALRPIPAGVSDPAPMVRTPQVRITEVPEPTDMAESSAGHSGLGRIPSTEELGLRDGRLRVDLAVPAGTKELLLLGAADLVRVIEDGTDRGVHVPHGAPLSLPVSAVGEHEVTVISETWGRANFDDARLPALAMGAGRGVGEVFAVMEVQEVTDLWALRRIPDRRGAADLAQMPLRPLGGWSSPQLGGDAVYVRELPLPSGDGEQALLRLRGLTQPVHIRLGDGEEQLVAPGSPVIPLPSVPRSDSVRVEVRAPHVPAGLGEGVELLRARRPDVRGLGVLDRAALSALISEAEQVHATAGPVLVGPGRPVVARLSAHRAEGAGVLLALDGTDILITVVAAGRAVSRHVLGSPAVAGGDATRTWIPASWLDGAAPEVDLLIEPLAPGGGIFGGVGWSDATT